MSKTLGGFLFVRNGNKYDYNFIQSIISLCESCDIVSVIADGDAYEGTWLNALGLEKKYNNLSVRGMDRTMWDAMKGRTKLANFQNIAAMCLDTDYQLLVQADEVLHPDSYKAVREAIETGSEGFLCERVNLWGDPNHMLVVPQERQPCSTSVIRLTKRGYWCYDDGENIGAPASTTFRGRIKIIHYGFVRKREVMKDKIINMQEGVFAMSGHDPKLDQCEVFDPALWFSGDDLAPINFTHPPIMNQWVIDRM